MLVNRIGERINYLTSNFSNASAYIIVIVAFWIFIVSCSASKPTTDSVKQEVIKRNDSTVIVQAGKIYKAGKFKRLMLGDHYRDVWLTPVEVPILNFKTEKGGLEIVERGGGMQTFSLKLKGGDGRLYSLRSIQKDPTESLPLALRYSFADDLVQDQISASLPYGAFILPPLAEAAGIYHTNPKLVYVPDTPVLGEYQKNFGGALAMLEEDADEDWTGYEDFGGTKNAVSTETVREALRNDNENWVDEKNFLRVRLFDMWIGDWDRHGGQFRWAEFEGEDGEYYRPIPEDRDNAFFKFDGFIPWWASRRWALRKFQNFEEEVEDIAGLNYNARHVDRRFLNELSKEDWLDIAKDLQSRLTDEIIEKAIKDLPEPVFELEGKNIINILQDRRNNLHQYAMDYYLILARDVDIVGSNENEYVEVIRSKDQTEVRMYNASGDGEKKDKRYSRVFHADETDEIKIYGLGEEDFFFVSGEADRGPLLRIIGGDDEDTFADSSKVSGWCKKTIYYDTKDINNNQKDDNKIEKGKETKLRLSNTPAINIYNYYDFKYGSVAPTLYFGANSDDGLFIGGGVEITTHGFRKEPYAGKQRIVANYAPKTSAWNFEYQGDFINVVGDLGVNLDFLARAPNYFTNFYGYGNETDAFTENEEFYDVRYEEILFHPGLKVNLGVRNNSTIKFGPLYQYAQVHPGDGEISYIDIIGPSLDLTIFEKSHYGGFKFIADVQTTEIEHKPEKGIRWLTELSWLGELNNDKSRLSILKSEFSVYYTIDIPFETTFATRIGGSTISGDFTFYQASSIGGNSGLDRLGTVRGYGRDRFAGRSSLYQNNEIRMRILKVPFYYMPFEIGISGHFDQGRVWIDGEDSNKWHKGVGGGLWITPFGRWVFTAVYTKSEEEGIYNLNLGFLF